MDAKNTSSKRRIISRMDKGNMQRILSVSDIFAIGYGDLGSSIYYALGITALYALGATPIALILAGFVFACTALTYAEMSSVIHEAGGSASYSRRAFNDLISFVAGWALMLDYIVTIAISAFSIPPYLSYFFPLLNQVPIQIGFTVLIIFVLVILNIITVKNSTKMSVVLTVLTIATQAVIIVIGFATLVHLPTFFSHLKIGGADPLWSPSWTNFIKGLAMAMVAYTGIESMAQLSSEAKNPGKTVPRAIVIAMVTLLLMYLGISTVALSAMTPQQLAGPYISDPLAGVVSFLPFGSKVLAPWIGLLAAILLFVAANAGLIGASRLSFNMGEFYQLPGVFYKLHSRLKTPYISLIIFGIFASLIVIWSRGQLTFLADLYNFGAMLAFFSAHIALMMHRVKHPDIKRPFRIPFSIKIKGAYIPITSIIGAIVTLGVWVLVVITKADGRYLGLFWMALGLGMYTLYRRKEKIDVAGSIDVKKIKIEDLQPVAIKKILVPITHNPDADLIQLACHLANTFKAQIKILYIREVPFSFPLNSKIYNLEADSEKILQQVEAISRELGVVVELEIARTRDFEKAVLAQVNEDKTDLVFLGKDHLHDGPSEMINEENFQKLHCRVWLCNQ